MKYTIFAILLLASVSKASTYYLDFGTVNASIGKPDLVTASVDVWDSSIGAWGTMTSISDSQVFFYKGDVAPQTHVFFRLNGDSDSIVAYNLSLPDNVQSDFLAVLLVGEKPDGTPFWNADTSDGTQYRDVVAAGVEKGTLNNGVPQASFGGPDHSPVPPTPVPAVVPLDVRDYLVAGIKIMGGVCAICIGLQAALFVIIRGLQWAGVLKEGSCLDDCYEESDSGDTSPHSWAGGPKKLEGRSSWAYWHYRGTR